MKHLLYSLLLAATCLIACDSDPGPVDPDEKPSLELCDAITTQRECFAKGCHYFTSASVLTQDGNTCTQGSTSSVCLFAPDSDDSNDTLTYYQRTRDDGTTQTLQLNVDAPIKGWDRCGALSAPPDCDCDGAEDSEI